MKIEKVKINKVKPNKDNPRVITDDKFKKLVNSIKEFPKMLEIRPIVVDNDFMVLGGNMRLKACIEAGMKEIFIIRASDLTEEEMQRFIIVDNLGFGKWDWEIITAGDWDISELENWGMDVPTVKNTELLSELKFESVYYEPINKPDIKLMDCIDLTKFEAKIEALKKLKLSKEEFERLKFFAYRFIKIDFENVANYYAFSASKKEQRAMERLRLVLVDNAINGFIEDDLLRVMDHENPNENDGND